MKKKNKIVPHKNCAFLREVDNSCAALTIDKCNELKTCKFFKTREKLKEERDRSKKRLKEIGLLK